MNGGAACPSIQPLCTPGEDLCSKLELQPEPEPESEPTPEPEPELVIDCITTECSSGCLLALASGYYCEHSISDVVCTNLGTWCPAMSGSVHGSIVFRFTLSVDIPALFPENAEYDAATEAHFNTAYKSDIAAALGDGISSDNIVILNKTAGSVIVDTAILPVNGLTMSITSVRAALGSSSFALTSLAALGLGVPIAVDGSVAFSSISMVTSSYMYAPAAINPDQPNAQQGDESSVVMLAIGLLSGSALVLVGLAVRSATHRRYSTTKVDRDPEAAHPIDSSTSEPQSQANLAEGTPPRQGLPMMSTPRLPLAASCTDRGVPRTSETAQIERHSTPPRRPREQSCSLRDIHNMVPKVQPLLHESCQGEAEVQAAKPLSLEHRCDIQLLSLHQYRLLHRLPLLELGMRCNTRV